MNVNYNRHFVEFIDPGHGWVAVPVELLKALRIHKQITPYSYISRSGKTAYLEEDVDATTFIRAWERLGTKYRSVTRYADNGSSIRHLPGYPTQWCD